MRAVILSLAVFAAPNLVAGQEKPQLVVEISLPKEIYPDEVLTPKVVIRNAGKEDLYVVRAIDGSFDGLRTLVDYRWIVKKGNERLGRRTDVRRIDNHVNALRNEDLLLVKPGKQVDPLENGFGAFSSHYKIEVPGKYTIAVSYEFNPVGGEKSVATNLQLVQKQPALLIESNPVEVTVVPFPPAVAAAADAVKAATARVQIVRQFAETVARNPNSTARERDAASERVTRAETVLAVATKAYSETYAEFTKERAERRNKK